MDALYGLPLEEFTPRRDELAKELRPSDREAATWVKGLRKPSAAAWLLNQLARTQRADAQRLLESGDALRAAQNNILAGKGSSGELAGAAVEHDEAMRTLMGKAPGLLNREGVSPSSATLDRAAETLRATALDEEARDGFAAGRLTRERRASGMGFAAGAPEKAPSSRKKPAPDRTQERERARAAVETAKARHQAAREAVVELGRELREAERDAKAAQRRADRAAAALARAREKEAHARTQLEDAQAEAKRV